MAPLRIRGMQPDRVHFRSAWYRRALVFFVGAHGLFPILWLHVLRLREPPRGDWFLFKAVADHFVAGDLARLYSFGPDMLVRDFYWLYPPYALYVVAPLAFFTPGWSYGLLAALGVVALVVAMAILSRMERLHGGGIGWCLAIVCSAPFFSNLIRAQNAALLTLCVAAAAAAASRGQWHRAGLLLGLLWLKPNWGAAFALALAVRGELAGLVVMGLVAAVLCASTIPLGMAPWAGFFKISMANGELMDTIVRTHFITLKGFFEALFGVGPLANALWMVSGAVLLVLAVRMWRRPTEPTLFVGSTVLFAIAVNPYALSYDALTLIVPATVWWSSRDQWRPARWRIVGALIAVAWVGEHAATTWPGLGLGAAPSFSVVGPVAAVWLALEAAESRYRSLGGGMPPARMAHSA